MTLMTPLIIVIILFFLFFVFFLDYYLYMSIFTSPEATNCFDISTLMIIRENKISDSETSTNLAAILKTASLQCYNHCKVIKAG